VYLGILQNNRTTRLQNNNHIYKHTHVYNCSGSHIICNLHFVYYCGGTWRCSVSLTEMKIKKTSVFELKYYNKYRRKEMELYRDHGALRSGFPHTDRFACGRNCSYLPQNKKKIFILIRHLKSQIAPYNHTKSYTHSVRYFPENWRLWSGRQVTIYWVQMLCSK